MPVRNLGAIINDQLRHRFISESFQQYGRKEYLLDLGCGIKPFAGIYSKYAGKSVGIDVNHSPHSQSAVDIIYDGKTIPFHDNEFDYVFCTEVMEHVPEPGSLLKEIYRVLKPGGILIMTTPFMVPLHEEPYDFYRYTKHGIKHLLTKAGLTPLCITAFAGYTGVLISMLVQPQLRFWNVMAKAIHLPVLFTVWNPFIMILVALPQYCYLALYRFKVVRKLTGSLKNNVRGYGYIAQKQL
ncbi:MAG: class I SAM-dependent methyltransferase [Bacteroidia bacterium]|nr:class I SAM-dependent methyltransferase [Bacteroidia bacterium]MCZ2277453.1 class I SAM-dependent methyltransferase [Bacteroidia bacterium]